ncbi:MAG TPA: heat-inducible transcriptional repressor HrcA [Ignavibacteriaceae bacterium]|nr:heat-inducible transcriptional repressor HrcA [Ignavibacteriaceae bacterium]
MEQEELTDREKVILRSIIQQFILTASPVGSRFITKKYDIGISPATVRNIMADLEESGFINHPHTSAGRVPTDKGYRFYVDSLMEIQKIKSSEKGIISKGLDFESNETEEILRITSLILSNITRQLACVTYPRLDSGILAKIQLVTLSTNRLLVVISIKGGLVKTITLEVASQLKTSLLESVQDLLNERLSGLTFKEIRSTFKDRFTDINEEQKPVIRLFVESVDRIFKEASSGSNLFITGAGNIIKQPEFEDPEKFPGIIELLENKDIIIHILDKGSGSGTNQVFISIGSENEDRKLEEYSFVSKEYQYGDTSGTLGVIGPKRMEYSKVVAIVDYMTKMLSEIFKSEN